MKLEVFYSFPLCIRDWCVCVCVCVCASDTVSRDQYDPFRFKKKEKKSAYIRHLYRLHRLYVNDLLLNDVLGKFSSRKTTWSRNRKKTAYVLAAVGLPVYFKLP